VPADVGFRDLPGEFPSYTNQQEAVMRAHLLGGLTVVALLGLGSCTDKVGITVSQHFTAVLSSANEVPADSSTATGTATFTYVSDLGSIFYRLDVAGIDSAFAAHIHAPAGVDTNAAVVINLFTGNPITKIGFTGTLEQGVLGELGAPVGMTMDSLLVLLRNGHAYVNVHTRGPVNATTHSGGHPAGEIRGQVVMQ
jgi:CHRD domain